MIGEKVIVIGVSTGGTCATWLAAQPFVESLFATILISPNFGPVDKSSQVLLWPWGKQIVKMVIGPERFWEAENELHDLYWTNRYPVAGLLPMMGLVKIVNDLSPSDILFPVLIIYSTQDQVVDPLLTENLYVKLGSHEKQIIPYENAEDPSHHVIAGDILSPSATQPIAQIIFDYINNL